MAMHTHFTKEFKLEAVRLREQTGKSGTETQLVPWLAENL